MRISGKGAAAVLLVIVLVLSVLPGMARESQNGARIEGLVIDLDGRPADGFKIHLIDESGTAMSQSDTGREGLYSFVDVQPGRYSLGVESPEGLVAPVTAPPVKVQTGELKRRDLRLMESDPATRTELLQGNYGLASWFGNLTTPAKAWTIIAVVGVVGITLETLDDDEEPASPVTTNP